MSDPGCFRLPLKNYPGMNPFVLDWLEGKADRFLRRDTAWKSAPLSADDRSRRAGLATALIESNQRWGFFVRQEVERWSRGETVTIVGGQQVGFAGGPLYTLAKIATLIRMKRDLEAAGTPATAMFWLATEDHDFDEVARLSLPTKGKKQLDLLHLEAVRGIESRTAVGTLPIPEPLIREFLAFCEMPRPAWLREGITFRDSFAELLSIAVHDGIILIDALLPELRRAGAPLFASIVAKWDEVQKDVTARSSALLAAGYAPQVIARDGEPYTLLFRLDGACDRQPFDGSAESPETISTSALTRPLLQDFALRPDIFLGGPAEVAYYAQIAGLHEMLDIPMPRIALRGHALVAPKRVVNFIPRFGIDPADIFTSVDRILARQEPAGVAEVQQIATDAQRCLNAAIDRIRELSLPADHALARSIQRSIGHLDYHFGKLTERAVRGLVRKDRERFTAVKELVSVVYPDRHVQDRVVGWIAYWNDFGAVLVDRVVEEIEPDAASFKVISV
jgi:uncharacterized protein YllA (UPF0747 family)